MIISKLLKVSGLVVSLTLSGFAVAEEHSAGTTEPATQEKADAPATTEATTTEAQPASADAAATKEHSKVAKKAKKDKKAKSKTATHEEKK